MLDNLNLNWLRTFEAAARHLSFTTAGRELGLTQTAVSQHIKALEQKLGQRLFVRRPKSLVLTDVGQAFLPSVRQGLATIQMTTSGLFGPNLSNTITIRASMACIVWLASRLESLERNHPGLRIKFVTSIWPGHTDEGATDLDIVLAPHNHAVHHLEKLSDESLVPLCGRKTSEKISCIGELTYLPAVHILGFDDHWAHYLAAHNLKHDQSKVRLVVDTSVAACEAAAAEQGCAIVIERFARQAIQSGCAAAIVGDPVPLKQSHYLSSGKSTKDDIAAVEAVASWLRSSFGDDGLH